jgi:hypothetical protein
MRREQRPIRSSKLPICRGNVEVRVGIRVQGVLRGSGVLMGSGVQGCRGAGVQGFRVRGRFRKTLSIQ